MAKKKTTAAVSDVYTAILALATLVVILTSAYVAVRCWFDYETLFKIIEKVN